MVLDKKGNFVHYIILIGLLVIFQVVLYYILTIVSTKLNNILAVNLKKDIFLHLFRTSKRAIDTGKSSYYTKRIDEDTKQIINFLFNDTMTMFINLIKLFIIIIYLYRINRNITLILLVLSILNICVHYIFKDKISKKYLVSIESENEFYSFQNKSLDNKNSILRKSLFTGFTNKYQELFNSNLKNMLDYVSVSTLYNSLCQVVRFVCLIVIIIIGGVEIINGTMSIGNFTLFNNYYNRLLDTIAFFTGYLKRYQDYKVSYTRLKEILKIPELHNGNTKIKNIDNIDVINLSMKINEKRLFYNLNFRFKKGNIYVIKGKNGIGKSTFFDVLLGIEQDYEGNICYNNKDISTIDLYEFRKNNVSFCEQNQDLIIDNILKYDNNNFVSNFIDSGIINKIIKKNELIEKGTIISGGEKQKLSLLQAILKDLEILLLDEPTNALDNKSISLLKKQLIKIKNNKIVIIISHNNDLLDICDYTINFDDINELKYS